MYFFTNLLLSASDLVLSAHSKWQHVAVLEFGKELHLSSHEQPSQTNSGANFKLHVSLKTCMKNTFGLLVPMVHVMDTQLQLILVFDSLLFSHKGEKKNFSCGKK